MDLNTIQKTVNSLIAISEEPQMTLFVIQPIHISGYAKAKHVHDLFSPVY